MRTALRLVVIYKSSHLWTSVLQRKLPIRRCHDWSRMRGWFSEGMAWFAVAAIAAISIALVLLLFLVSRRAADKLRRSRQFLATVLRSIGDGVIATDAGGLIRFLNPVAAHLTGWSPADAEGRNVDEVFRTVG